MPVQLTDLNRIGRLKSWLQPSTGHPCSSLHPHALKMPITVSRGEQLTLGPEPSEGSLRLEGAAQPLALLGSQLGLFAASPPGLSQHSLCSPPQPLCILLVHTEPRQPPGNSQNKQAGCYFQQDPLSLLGLTSRQDFPYVFFQISSVRKKERHYPPRSVFKLMCQVSN